MRWNGSVIGRKQAEGKGAWSLRSHCVLRQGNDWPYPIGVPITSNLIFHIDASRPETVTLNGGYVSKILDLSSSPKTVDQTTAANQPLYVPNAQNGLNAMLFDLGYSHSLNVTSTTIPASHTMFWVFRRSSGEQAISLASASRYSYWYHPTNTIFQDSNGQTSGTPSSPHGGWFYGTTRRNGTTQIRLRRNGTTVNDATSGLSAASGSWDRIGLFSTTSFSRCLIGEIIAYDTNLSDGDVDSVESYLATKWNI